VLTKVKHSLASFLRKNFEAASLGALGKVCLGFYSKYLVLGDRLQMFGETLRKLKVT
jgi:hypothetical protein